MTFDELPLSAQNAIRNHSEEWNYLADVPLTFWIWAMGNYNLITPAIETDLFPYLFAGE